MRLRLIPNFIPARAQAALVALLYVFLCTFGMVTHTHAFGDSHSNNSEYRQTSVERGQAKTKISKRTLLSSPHCSFCDWQANSQARTVAVWHYAAPLTFTYFYARHSAPLSIVFSVRSSSRAPPVA